MIPSSCRLYLRSPSSFDPVAFRGLLEQALDAGDVAAFLLSMPEADEPTLRTAIQALAPLMRERDIALLLDGDPDVAIETDLDGVEIDCALLSVRDVRKIMGDDRIVGAHARSSRHLAMTAGEQSADYVAFYQDQEIVRWWADMMEVPGAVDCADLSQTQKLVLAGTDFLRPGLSLWTCKDGPAAMVREIVAMIASIDTEEPELQL
ncbi:MAG: thiamine phosphate synthase [Pseudomonadota bacterium]|nr:thiamine phosphate synthase [Pseudomonadota bacterium]